MKGRESNGELIRNPDYRGLWDLRKKPNRERERPPPSPHNLSSERKWDKLREKVRENKRKNKRKGKGKGRRPFILWIYLFLSISFSACVAISAWTWGSARTQSSHPPGSPTLQLPRPSRRTCASSTSLPGMRFPLRKTQARLVPPNLSLIFSCRSAQNPLCVSLHFCIFL